MLWEYITANYSKGEPIIASDINIGISDVNKRKKLKELTDSGRLCRYENGVYFIPKPSRLNGFANLSPELVIEKKYVYRNEQIMGYYGGSTFANLIGVSSQVPFTQEIVTNEIGVTIKRIELNGRNFILRKARTKITAENVRVLQLLDLIKDIDVYTEYDKDEKKRLLRNFTIKYQISKKDIDKYLPLYPEKIYKSLYQLEASDVFTQ